MACTTELECLQSIEAILAPSDVPGDSVTNQLLQTIVNDGLTTQTSIQSISDNVQNTLILIPSQLNSFFTIIFASGIIFFFGYKFAKAIFREIY